MRPNHPTGTLGIVGSRAPSEWGFDAKLTGGNLLHGDIGDGSTWLTTSADAAMPYVVNRWRHVAYTVGAGQWIAYVDGVEAARGSYTGTALLWDASHQFSAGVAAGPESFDGEIDEVVVYDAVLAPHRIAARHDAGTHPLGPFADLGSVSMNATSVAGDDCTVEFGSSDSTAMLRIMQADADGTAAIAVQRLGLKGWWPLDGSGLNAVDEDGAADMVLETPPADPSWVAGRSGGGGALRFDGDDEARISRNLHTNGAAYTVQAWVNVSSIANSDFPTILAGGTGGSCAGQFRLGFRRATEELTASAGTGECAGTNAAMTPASDLVGAGWHHVAAAVDLRSNPQSIRLYVDGELRSHATFTGAPISFPGTNLSLGRVTGRTDTWLEGDIDDIRLSRLPLSDEQIRADATAAIPDYGTGAATWSGGDSLFGACLRAVSGARVTGSWSVDADAACTAVDSDPWNAIPATPGPTAKVASSTIAGTTNGTASLRFGVGIDGSQPSGSYAAPLVIDVSSPDI